MPGCFSADCEESGSDLSAEVTEINKQKFLAELEKLLAFMYEEDRQTALAMYGRIFDDAESEQAVLQQLFSPTRQAINVARVYNAKERKLQVESQSRGDSAQQDAAPSFLLEINRIYDEIFEVIEQRKEQAPAETQDENQFCLFTDPDAPHPIKDSEYVPLVLNGGKPGPETGAELNVELDEDELQIAEPEEAEESVQEAAPYEEEPAAVHSEAPREAPHAAVPIQSHLIPEEEELDVETPAEEILTAPSETVEGDKPRFGYGSLEAEKAPEEEEPAAAEQAPQDEEETNVFEEQLSLDGIINPSHQEIEHSAESARLNTVRKPRVFLLILYTLIAIPVTLIGLALLLVPTALCLALAAAVIAVGATALLAAFTSGLTPFANILLVIGAGLIVLALGLLFLWLFVWFIFGCMGGLIRGIVNLGRSWCYREVLE